MAYPQTDSKSDVPNGGGVNKSKMETCYNNIYLDPRQRNHNEHLTRSKRADVREGGDVTYKNPFDQFPHSHHNP